MEQESASEKGLKATFIGVLVNLLLAVVKGLAGYFGNSFALLADAIESISDVFTSLIVFLGIKVATKERNQKYPYGHGKAEPIAAAVVSLVLISAGILIIINSLRNIRVPHEVPEPYTLLVLVLVIIIKEWLYRRVEKVGQEVKSTALKADAWHHRSDAITSATAFIGITIAIIGGPGYESADDYAAMVASCFIMFNSYNILKPALKEIMDAAPPEDIIEEVRVTAEQVEGVLGLDKCFVRKMGFDYYVDMHVIVDGELPVRIGHDIAHKVKDEILLKNPRVTDVIVHIEPYDPEHPANRPSAPKT